MLLSSCPLTIIDKNNSSNKINVFIGLVLLLNGVYVYKYLSSKKYGYTLVMYKATDTHHRTFYAFLHQIVLFQSSQYICWISF